MEFDDMNMSDIEMVKTKFKASKSIGLIAEFIPLPYKGPRRELVASCPHCSSDLKMHDIGPMHDWNGGYKTRIYGQCTNCDFGFQSSVALTYEQVMQHEAVMLAKEEG